MINLSLPTKNNPLPPGTIVHEHIQVLKTIGHGAYGKVYLGYDRQTKKRYAIKALLQKQDGGGSDAAAAAKYEHQRYLQRNEMILHSKLNHPNIIRLEHLVKQDQYIHMVLEHSSEGDLFSAITDKNYYYGNHALIRQVFLQLIDAVKYCHDHGVYHRDLKPENILVFDHGRTLKVADFGLATAEPIAKDFGCGSTFYFSPECQGDDVNLANGYATAPNDVWALGVILLNLAAGRNPWRQACLADETFRSYLSNRDHLYGILPISRELNCIIKRIFCIDPTRRVGLDQLRESILGCKYFTRTSQVERVENNGLPGARRNKLSLQSIFPPSPPVTPNCVLSNLFPPSPTSCCSSSSSGSTVVVDDVRVEEEDENVSAAAESVDCCWNKHWPPATAAVDVVDVVDDGFQPPADDHKTKTKSRYSVIMPLTPPVDHLSR